MDELRKAIDERRPVRLVAYSVSPAIEGKIKEILHLHLSLHRCEVLHDSLYTAIKELLINAVKANYKNIYFENYSPKNNLSGKFDYATALELFKLELARNEGSYLADIAKRKNLNAEIVWRLFGETLSVYVINPVSMTDIELRNVQKKLAFARNCTDISEYFMIEEEDENQEGAGLGLILIMMILKSLGGGEENLSIKSANGKTVAALTIPLTESTLSHYRRQTAH